jgi:hypothetical protein
MKRLCWSNSAPGRRLYSKPPNDGIDLARQRRTTAVLHAVSIKDRSASSAQVLAMRLQARRHAEFVRNVFAAKTMRVAAACPIFHRTHFVVVLRPGGGGERY